MLNEERIKLMTHMASYEESEGRRNMAIGSYFRSDYIGWQLLKTVISSTIVFLILIAAFIFYDFELVMKDVYQVDLLETGKKFLLIYVIFTGIYTVISYIVYSYRYSRARKSLKKYYSHLENLSSKYNEDFKR